MNPQNHFPFQAALVSCNGGCRASQEEPACAYGCTGCGICVEACKYDAIHINEIGVAEVDEEKCSACGACVRECPRQVIHLHGCANYIAVKCSNRDKGVDTKTGHGARKVCSVSCIGCGLCEKICSSGAIHVVESCAVIDESLCLSCGMCAVKCPRHAIVDLRGILTPLY